MKYIVIAKGKTRLTRYTTTVAYTFDNPSNQPLTNADVEEYINNSWAVRSPDERFIVSSHMMVPTDGYPYLV